MDEQVPDVLGSADVLIVLLDTACGGFAVPSKTLTYMCAGRPILLAPPPENLTNGIITGSGSGVSVSSENEESFIEAARKLYLDQPLRTTLGRNARKYAERTFDIQRVSARFTGIFENAMSARVALEKESPANGYKPILESWRRWIPWKSFHKTA